MAHGTKRKKRKKRKKMAKKRKKSTNGKKIEEDNSNADEVGAF